MISGLRDLKNDKLNIKSKSIVEREEIDMETWLPSCSSNSLCLLKGPCKKSPKSGEVDVEEERIAQVGWAIKERA